MSDSTSVNNKRIAKNTMYMYLRMGITMLVSLYTSRVVLSNLGITDFGIYNVVGSFVAAFSFISGPLSGATQRFYNYELGRNNEKQVNVIFNMSFIIYLVLAIFLFIIIQFAGIWFINNKMSLPPERLSIALVVFELSIASFVFNLLKTPFDSLVIANEKMSFYAWMSIVDVILKLANAFSLILFAGDKLELFAINVLIINIIVAACVAVYCLKKFTYVRFLKANDFWNKQTFDSLFGFSAWSLFGSVATMTATQGLNLLLNVFFGVIVNAAMGVANQINNAVTQFVNSFQVAFRPQIVKYYASNQIAELKVLIIRTSKVSYLLLFWILCPFWFNVNYILDLWLGGQNVPDFAAPFCILMTIYVLQESVQTPLFNTVQATGRIKTYQLIISTAIFLNIIISYIFLRMGFNPTVVLTIKCCVDFLYLIIRLIFVKKMIGLSILSFIKEVIVPLFIITLLCLVTMFGIIPIFNTPLTKLMVSILVFITFYPSLVLLMGLNKHERRTVLEKANTVIVRK